MRKKINCFFSAFFLTLILFWGSFSLVWVGTIAAEGGLLPLSFSTLEEPQTAVLQLGTSRFSFPLEPLLRLRSTAALLAWNAPSPSVRLAQRLPVFLFRLQEAQRKAEIERAYFEAVGELP